MSETMRRSSRDGVHSLELRRRLLSGRACWSIFASRQFALGSEAAEGNVTTIPAIVGSPAELLEDRAPPSGRLLSGNLIADGLHGSHRPTFPAPAARRPPAARRRRNTPIVSKSRNAPQPCNAHQGFRPRCIARRRPPRATVGRARRGSRVSSTPRTSLAQRALVRFSQPHPTASQPWRATAQARSLRRPSTHTPTVELPPPTLISHGRATPSLSPPPEAPGPHGTCKSITSQRHAQGSRATAARPGEVANTPPWSRRNARSCARHDPQNSPRPSDARRRAARPRPRAPSRYRPAGKTDGTPRGAQGVTGPRREAKRSMSRSQSQSGETRLQRQPTPTTYGVNVLSLAGTRSSETLKTVAIASASRSRRREVFHGQRDVGVLTKKPRKESS
ncbi:hypothetical protein Q5P01_000096 [Channa striata]|uniref:Uncharacterized protein n=1 Tax=Channa striata TaxID=64152 RepID=A0AA88IFY0_CHASR|nr:hypothetical protein Q5P01_000096 [Channa striata]